MILLAGDLRRISRAALGPPPPGIRTSRMATSGCSTVASWIAVSASLADPAISRSLSAAISAVRTSRTDSSSSAIKTLMRPIVLISLEARGTRIKVSAGDTRPVHSSPGPSSASDHRVIRRPRDVASDLGPSSLPRRVCHGSPVRWTGETRMRCYGNRGERSLYFSAVSAQGGPGEYRRRDGDAIGLAISEIGERAARRVSPPQPASGPHRRRRAGGAGDPDERGRGGP